MHIDDTTTKEQLQECILFEEDPSLYAMIDEPRFLNDGYTREELLQIVSDWIEAGDECPVVPNL